jgi:UDP-glucose 4-epimerase
LRKNILILGGTGFIGNNLIKKLSNSKYNITSLSLRKKKNIKTINNVKYIRTDLSDREKLKKYITNDYQIIINLSGNIDHKNYNQAFNIHYKGLKNLLDLINFKNLDLFIQAGSSLEYGNQKSPQIEKKRCKPVSTYGKAKYLGSKLLLKRFKKVIILRLYQVYGPYQKYDRLIPFVIKSCIKNKKFDCSEGSQLRDFLHVDDLSNLFQKIINSKNIKYGTYNVGTGKPTEVKKIILLINKLIKKGKPIFGKKKMRSDEIDSLYPNIMKIRKNFDWKPRIGLLTGLKWTINYYKKKKL